MLFWIYLIYFVGILVCINLSTLLVAVMERNIVEVDDDKTLFLLANPVLACHNTTCIDVWHSICFISNICICC